jgi:hypothetical protein
VAPGSQAIQDTLTVLQGRALFEGPLLPVGVRLAERDGVLYRDLADAAWRVVEITRDSWRVISEPPVKFRRSRGMLPLPLPVADGSIEELRRFINTRSDEDFMLIVAWLTAAFRAKGPYPILILLGEQGNAKPTTSRVLRALVDPNAAPLRAEPRELRDLYVATANSWMQALDYVSRLPPQLSDALCRLAPGGDAAVRELYTDLDEIFIDVQRPELLNGITEFATRADLLDRALPRTLSRIPTDERQTEDAFFAEFEAARPKWCIR